MQWCNLFLSASKYNVNLRRSRHKRAFYISFIFSVILALIISLTYAYLLALGIAVICLISISVYLSINSDEPIICRLTITHDGIINFNQDEVSYQLLPSSRFGFVGCCLYMLPSKTLASTIPTYTRNTSIPQQYFIYKDSLTSQDFSRVVKIIKQLC